MKVRISYELGKGTFSVAVLKDEEGNPKYEFTEEKPTEIEEFDKETLSIIESLKIEENK